MDGQPTRCECCNQIITPPLPLCECGHPMNSHHATATGNITYCTCWILTSEKHPNGSMNQCPCKRAKEQQ